MKPDRCTWHDHHAQCEETEDLVSYESPDPWTPARLLCGQHLLAAHDAQRQRVHLARRFAPEYGDLTNVDSVRIIGSGRA